MAPRPPAFLKIESQTKNKICLKGRIISQNQGLTWEHFEDKTLFEKLWFHSGCNPWTPPSLKIARKRSPTSSHPPDTAALSLRRRAVKGENNKNRLPSPDFRRTLNEPHKLISFICLTSVRSPSIPNVCVPPGWNGFAPNPKTTDLIKWRLLPFRPTCLSSSVPFVSQLNFSTHLP